MKTAPVGVRAPSKPSKHQSLESFLRPFLDRQVRGYYSCNPHVNRVLRARAYARAVREEKN